MLKVAVSYRVMQSWRVPVFSRLSKKPDIDLCVFHGEDFGKSKVVNFKGRLDFKAEKLSSFRLTFRTGNGTVHLPFNFGLWKALKRYDPDVIVTEGASNAFNNLICYVYARLYRRKIVQWGLGQIRGRTPSWPRRIMDMAFFRYIERSSDAAIAYSSIGADYYRNIGLPADRVYIAVNTVDTAARQAAARAYALESGRDWPSARPKRFNILFVGALTENKNVDVLLRVFARLNKEFHDITMTIVGDGDQREELEGLASNLSIDKEVSFVGHVSEDIAPFFFDATVMVLPGLGGLAVSDALCHGVPIICGIGDGSEVDLVTSENGKILDPLNEETLFGSLRKLYLDPEMQLSWRKHSMKVIQEQYNIKNYVEKLERCVRDLASC